MSTRRQGSFGDRLRRLRETAGFSQETLAERAGLSVNAISAIERGERKRPYPDTIRRLSDALGLAGDDREALVASARPDRSPATPGESGQRPHGPSSIPPEPDVLLGREQEINATRRLLGREETRVLTFIGPGGIGKTRLAIRLAHVAQDSFADGVAWIDLAAVPDSSLLLPAVSKALGITPTPRDLTPASIRTAIGDRQLMLVLDNAEHVRDAAPQISEILQGCPGLKIIATSRAPLEIRGEQDYPVAPLALPDTGPAANVASVAAAPSAQLFVRAVQRRDPAFLIGAGTAATIGAICHRLEGVPLALELAAARVPLLGVHDLLARLDASLPLLTGGQRDLPSRQRTMEATIRWSHDLLTPEEQWLFRLLSVFAGGWTIEALDSVVASTHEPAIDHIADMGALIDQSLVQRGEDRHGRVRYSMLGTFREFGRLRLREAGEESVAVRAHLHWVTTLAESAEPHLTGPAQDFWLDQLAAEIGNIRAALGCDVEGTESERLRLAASVWRYWYIRGPFAEGRAWLERCLDSIGDADEETTARASNGAGILSQESGDFARAEEFHNNALRIRRALGDRPGIAYSLSNLGLLADHRGNYDRAISLYEESLALSRELGHQSGEGNALNNLGLVYRDLGDTDRARELHEESLLVLRRIGDQRGTANAINNLGNIAIDMDDLPEAASLHLETLGIRRRLDDRPGIAMSLKNLGTIARARGENQEAARLYRESIGIRQELSDVLGAIPALGEVAVLADSLGCHNTAVQLVSCIRTLRGQLGAPPPPAARAQHEAIIHNASATLSAPSMTEAERAGSSMRAEDAISLAIEFLQAVDTQAAP